MWPCGNTQRDTSEVEARVQVAQNQKVLFAAHCQSHQKRTRGQGRRVSLKLC